MGLRELVPKGEATMIAAIYARKSTDQAGAGDKEREAALGSAGGAAGS